MGILLALLLTGASSEGRGAPVEDALTRRFAITLGVGADVQPQFGGFWIANFATWVDLEATWRARNWLRAGLISGAAWSGENRPAYPGQHGLFRLLACGDLILAVHGVDLFLGMAAGIQHTNLYYDDVWRVPPGYSTGWMAGVALQARAGADFRITEAVGLGVVVAYGYFNAGYVEERHSFEAHGRVSIRF